MYENERSTKTKLSHGDIKFEGGVQGKTGGEKRTYAIDQMISILDCPCNCPYLYFAEKFDNCCCGLGLLPIIILPERYGGENKV